jgi:hypothetical protein
VNSTHSSSPHNTARVLASGGDTDGGTMGSYFSPGASGRYAFSGSLVSLSAAEVGGCVVVVIKGAL